MEERCDGGGGGGGGGGGRVSVSVSVCGRGGGGQLATSRMPKCNNYVRPVECNVDGGEDYGTFRRLTLIDVACPLLSGVMGGWRARQGRG